MWLIVPLIYYMSWRSYRAWGQAVSETAAWVVGYLATAGLIMLLNWGNFRLISDAPDGPGYVVAVVGGFGAMALSRYLWKRRGGHLNRKEIPWMRLTGRAYKAMRGAPKPRRVKPVRSAASRTAAPQSAAQGAATAATTQSHAASMPNGSAGPTTNGARPASKPSPSTSTATRAAMVAGRQLGRNQNVRKAASNRWVRGSARALGAMLSDDDAKKRPGR